MYEYIYIYVYIYIYIHIYMLQWLIYIYIAMLSYFLKCRKNTESKNPKVVRTESGRIMLLSKYEVCDSKKAKLHKSIYKKIKKE